MFSIWTLAAITAIYLLALFGIAFIGTKLGRPSKTVYALALGVHCTSWAFFGTTTQAVNFGWAFVPTYLGVILVMLFGYSTLVKISQICQQYKISSLAEFIGIRFHHSNMLAAMVVILCFIGVIPYVALQLDAISTAITLMTKDNVDWSGSISFYVAASMAIFAILFGTRTLDLTSKRNGLMLTIAFESILKLVGLLTVGIYCVYILSDGWIDLFEQSLATQSADNILKKPSAYWIYASHVLLGICSMFCLPRQFHINFIENNNQQELARARWVFPIYLVLMSVFILPIALTGQIMFVDSSVNSDSFVLSIPLSQGNMQVTLVAFLGGLAASTSMVIVATLALGNMVANNLLAPLWLISRKVTKGEHQFSGTQLLRIRQVTIIALLFIAYWYHQNISQSAPLVNSGTIAISLMAQTLPAILFGLYWRLVNTAAVMSGALIGTLLVFLLMLYPAFMSSYYFAQAPSDIDLANALFIALSINIGVVVFGTLWSPSQRPNPFKDKVVFGSSLTISAHKLQTLLSRILPVDTFDTFLKTNPIRRNNQQDIVSSDIIGNAQQVLASHVGNASAGILLNTISDHQYTNNQEITELVEMATQSFHFNHEVLQSSIAHLPQGISVVDSELNLVAWNAKYENLFDYPKDYLRKGLCVKEILEFNAQRGLIPHKENQIGVELSQRNTGYQHQHQHQQFDDSKRDNDSESAVQKRLSLMKLSKTYKFVRQHGDNKTIEIEGSPLPGGGYITSFTDISEYILIQQQLESSKRDLEQRVIDRTAELELAKQEAELANISKTKFLAATGHDLMQPFNAAILFASLLHEKLANTELEGVSDNLLQSLENADQLLSMLIEITKLETGKISPNISPFSLNELLQNLSNDFAIIARQKNISLHYIPTTVWLNTDKRLLSRVVQNLLANAVRYTAKGKVLMGVRRRPNHQIEIMVIDTGMGIAKDNQTRVFNEFLRLNNTDSVQDELDNQGLGLGLTIVDKTARLLNIGINLRSELGAGTSFGLRLQRLSHADIPLQKAVKKTTVFDKNFLQNKTVLVVENDPNISLALSSLLSDWGATVAVCNDLASAKQLNCQADLIIADFHLDNGDTGIDVCRAMLAILDYQPMMILSSADRSESIQELAIESKIYYLPKPIKGAALKRLIQLKLGKHTDGNVRHFNRY